jgi:hypothetical protein
MRRLTKIEVSFLGWLRDQGGKCAFSGNNQFSKYYRLVKAGYVEMQLPDRFNPSLVDFKLTESGQGIQRPQRVSNPSVRAAHTQTAPAGFPELLEGSLLRVSHGPTEHQCDKSEQCKASKDAFDQTDAVTG